MNWFLKGPSIGHAPHTTIKIPKGMPVCSIDLFFQISFKQYVKSIFWPLLRSFRTFCCSLPPKFDVSKIGWIQISTFYPHHNSPPSPSSAPGRHEPGLPQTGPPGRGPRAAGRGSVEDLRRCRGLLRVLRRLHLVGSEEKCDRRWLADGWWLASRETTSFLVNEHELVFGKEWNGENLSGQVGLAPSAPFYSYYTVHPSTTGFKMPMCCSQAERRDVERIISNAKLRGTYLPLRNMAREPVGYPQDGW